MSQVEKKNNDASSTPAKPAELPLGTYVACFFFSCWLSILPASTCAYIGINLAIDLFPRDILGAVSCIAFFLVLSHVILVLATWGVAKLGVHVVCKGKPVEDGRFESSATQHWQNFMERHLVKKFSMWLFQHHVPHWLYRKYVGTFIKMGKHVEIPEWVAMENAEIGDNTIFARQTVLASHVIDGKVLNIKTVKIGKNCIVDADDEAHRVVIMPGSVVEDDVIIKPGTYIAKDSVLKAGGIYQGDFYLDRIGSVSDMSAGDLEAYRKAVRRKRVMKSSMISDWSSFKSPWPRIIYKIADLVGYVAAFAFLGIFWTWVFPAIISTFGLFGHVLNTVLLPALLFAAYGFYLYIPLPLIAKSVHHYDKHVPVLPDDPDASITIDDQEIIDAWRKCKWLKWQAVDRVNRSLFLDTSMLVYQRIGKNNVAFKTVLYNAKLDTDYITVGDNTLLSFGCHIYAYELENRDGKARLVLKRTIIGKNCILGSAIIHAGARIGDDVVLGFHTVVPENAVLESGKTYAGNPAMEFSQFLALRKKLKEAAKNR